MDEHIFEQLIEESRHIPGIQVLSNADQVVEHEPILAAVKNRLHAGILSSVDTNGNIHEFCCELKRVLIETYQVQFLFNQQIDSFVISNSDDWGGRHVDGLVTSDKQVLQEVDNVILTTGNYVMPLMQKLNIYIPIYPVKVK